MHPVMRVLWLLALAAMLPRMPLTDLCVLAVLLLAAYRYFAAGALSRLLAGIVRIRYLLAAIAVLYVGFTPGEPLWDRLPGISREGVIEGGRRAMVLVDLLIAVYLLLAVTAVTELAAAIAQLLWPLSRLGLPLGAVAPRISMTLAAVPELEAALRAERARSQSWLGALSGLVERIERGQLPAVPPGPALRLPPPKLVQFAWLLPIVPLWQWWPG